LCVEHAEHSRGVFEHEDMHRKGGVRYALAEAKRGMAMDIPRIGCRLSDATSVSLEAARASAAEY
jgi:hypothetical protein